MNPYQGACLYLPSTHPRLEDVVCGQFIPELRVAVICLEDALASHAVEAGLRTLRALHAGAGRSPAMRVYIRPRGPEMLRTILAWGPTTQWDGYVVPKLGLSNLNTWLNLLDKGSTPFMPILETEDVFCPARLGVMLTALTHPDVSPRISAVRFGAADLFGVLGTRRSPRRTLYESILGPTISTAAVRFMSAGLPVAAPVCENLVPDGVVAEEVAQDVEAGFIGKTAVNPAQVRLINTAFAVSRTELEEARAVLGSTEAVFRLNGTLCEVGPHSRWARRVLQRHEVFGVRSADNSVAPAELGSELTLHPSRAHHARALVSSS
jgi:citrate lyase beta subunit